MYLAGVASGLIAIAGVIGYGLLSAGASRAYEVVGVQPREIGLSSGVVLAQTTIAIGVVVVIMLAPAVLGAVFFSGWLRRGRHLAILAACNLLLTAAVVFTVSSQARSSLVAGRSTAPMLGLALPSPWHASVAQIRWADKRPLDAEPLPPCALYLGSAEGTTVIYDHRRQQTLRIPDSMIVVSIRPRVEKC